MTDTQSVQTLDPSPDVTHAQPAPVAAPASPRDPLWVRLSHVALIAIVACLAVWHGWKADHILAPTDALKLVPPWATLGHEYIANNEQLLDQTTQFVPWTYYAVQSYKVHQIPLWNPHAGIGQPFLANGQSAIFYPTILLHLGMSPMWSYVISAALRLFIAGLGAWMLAGRYGLRSWARLLPAIAFMLCGFNIVWLNHPQTNVMPLLPWAILLTEMLVERVRFYRILGATLVFALAFLGGHPATMVHLLLACFVVWVWRVAQHGLQAGRLRGCFRTPKEPPPCPPPKYRRRVLKQTLNGGIARVAASGAGVGVAIGFGFAIAAAQWLPMIEYARNSGAMEFRQEKLASAKFFETDVRFLIGMVFPYANGFPDGVAPFEMRQATKLPNTNELAPGFIGIIPLVLAIFGIATLFRKRTDGSDGASPSQDGASPSHDGASPSHDGASPSRSTPWLLFTLALLCVLIAIRFPIIDHLVRFVPILKVSQNARLLGVAALALSLLSGFGLVQLIHLLDREIDPRRLRRTLGWLAALTLLIAALGGAGLMIFKGKLIDKGVAAAEKQYAADTVHEHSLAHVKTLVSRIHEELLLTDARLLIPAGMFLGFGALLWLNKNYPLTKTGTIVTALFVLTLIDLLAFAIPFNPASDRKTYFPDTKLVRAMESLPSARFAGTFRTFIPETATAYGLDDLRSYDALAPRRYYDFWRHEGIGDLPDHMQGYLSRLTNPEHKAWSLLNFGYLVTPIDQPAPSTDLFKSIPGGGDEAQIFQATTLRPRAWIAGKAQVLDSEQAVLDRVAKMDFNPDDVVLLDKGVAWDQKKLLDETLARDARFFDSTSSSRATVTFTEATKNEQQRPEIVRLRISGGGGGWLVLADACTPGWTAYIIDDRGGGRETPVLPAYGCLRAIQIPAGTASARVEFRYRPWSWRIGAMMSMMSICVFGLLCAWVGCRKAFARNDGVS